MHLILSFSRYHGTVNNCTLERESTLGGINENLSLADHIDFVSKKVNQRLGVLRRIKHLLPNYARNVFVSVMVLPFYDYCDIIWGDRNSKALMDSLQVLHNKIVLNRPVHSSSTQALIDLSRWINLRVRRRFHRLVHIFKCLKALTLQTTFFQ